MNNTYLDNLAKISMDIKNASLKSGDNVKLVLVSKSQKKESIENIYRLGYRCFGENYLQEAREKIESLKSYDIEWHFIGRIQSNKIKEIVKLFDWIHTVSSKKHIEMIDRFSRKFKKNMNVCVQINIDGEETKSGLNLNQIDDFMSSSGDYNNIKMRGIMAIPSKANALEKKGQSYALLSEKFTELRAKFMNFDTLSLGMSNDYKLALAHNANLIRIGTLVFGARQK
tara:strand:- start:1007 stop:1687 length:681 start_codon:yes stop_codon:yes gene_type:complete